MRKLIRVVLTTVGSLALLAGVGWLGLQVKPKPILPSRQNTQQDSSTAELPPHLPEPVGRNLRATAGARRVGTCLMMHSVCFAAVLADGSPRARYATCSTSPSWASCCTCCYHSYLVSNGRRPSWAVPPSCSSSRLWRRRSSASCASRKFSAAR